MYGYLGLGSNMLVGLLSKIENANKQRLKEELGITSIEGCEGIERLNIPHKYDIITVHKDYFICRLPDSDTVYNKEGKFFFECTKFTYYNDNMFLVGNKSKEIKKDEGGYVITNFGYALYKEEIKLTEDIFTPSGMSYHFNECGYTEVGYFPDYGKHCIINKSGEIILKSESYFDYFSLKGAICSFKHKYHNLLTLDIICEGNYNTPLETDEFLFVQVEKNCIYQIRKKDGDFIIHGVAPVKELPKAIESPEDLSTYTIKKNTQPSPKKQSRNESCHCGSGKKYKFCCINK